MHTDLSPHLHTDDCNKLIDSLQRCYTDHLFKKFFGVCNHLDAAVAKCLKAERIRRRDNNYELSVKRHAEIRRRITEDVAREKEKHTI